VKLTRRSFLEAVVVTVGTLEGCSSSNSSGGPSSPPTEDGQQYFPQSVASGDPRPDAVVLWTRAIDASAPGDLRLTLEIAIEAAFQSLVVQKNDLPATSSHDNALKVKVTGLMPHTTYYYRFVYEVSGKRYASKTGRTKTAALASDDVPVKFAVASCQDFSGRYYNAWQRLADLGDDLDFVLFIGDYIYETTGDPSFQTTGGTRTVTLTDPTSAIQLGTASAPFYAAQSVSNYRDLYRTFRSDAFLQKVHELYPFVFIWDDHEYSDDCWGATANYFDGRKDEKNVDRRRNAEQAFFEYVPLDSTMAADGAIDVDAIPRYPDTKIYRDLGFGKHVRIIVADYRTYRPDHLIPEGAYPGTVVMPADAVMAAGLTDAFSSDAFAYIDIDAPENALVKSLLSVAYQQLARAAGLDDTTAMSKAADVVKGNLALVYVNAVLTNPTVGLPAIDATGKPRGLAWVHMGKRDLFSSTGARYVVLKDTLDAYAAYQYSVTQGANEDAYGSAQRAWLDGALAAPETWKVLVSSVSMTSMIIDLRDKTDLPDPFLKARFYLNCDQWDGFPDAKKDILGKLAKSAGGKAFVVAGDIHASFASIEQGVACLTGPAISSQTVGGEASTVAVASGFDPTSSVYRYVVTEIEPTFKAGNPGLVYTDTDGNGFLLVAVNGADDVVATFYSVPSSEVKTDYAARGQDLAGKFRATSLRVAAGAITPM
jgi:alkaline phosphatase D